MRATLPVKTADQQMQTIFSVPRPSEGGGVYVGFELRRQANGDAYRVRVRVTSTSRILLSSPRFGTYRTHVGPEITLRSGW